MTRNVAKVALAGIVVLGLLLGATFAAAQEPKAMSLAGQVVSVNAEARTVVVKAEVGSGQAREVTFTVGPQTKLQKDGKPVVLADIKAGDKVSVEYESANGKNMALVIGVRPATTT